MACSQGFFGKNCESCPRGRFGTKCAGRCLPECTYDDCNPVIGCQKSTKNQALAPDKSSYSVKTTNQLKSKLRTTTVFLQIFESSLSEKSASTSTLDINYLLIGVGTLIIILLSILVLQSFKKSKSSRRVTLKSPKVEKVGDNIFKKNFNRNKTLRQSCSSTEKSHYCDLIDTEYGKRGECICDQQRQASACSNESEINIIPLKWKNSNYPLRTEMHSLNSTTSEAHTLPRTCTAETYLTSIGSDQYIDPVFSKDENPTTKTINFLN